MTTFLLGSDGGDDYADWTTMQLTESEADGDTVSFRKGETFREQITVPASGSSSVSRITYNAHGAGADPIINGADVISTWTAVAAGWQTAWDLTLDTDWTDSSERNYRTRMLANVSSYSGSKIRISVTADASGAFTVDGCSIGLYVTPPDYSAAPTRITWVDAGGGNGITIAAGTTEVSDEITFDFDKTVQYGFHFYLASRDNGMYLAGGATFYNDATTNGDETLIQDITGAGWANYVVLDLLEVYVAGQADTWQATLTTEPEMVFFNEGGTITWGDQKTSVATCVNEYDWYWSANVLYVYAATDPDDRYTSIEASVRSQCIDTGSADRSYITIQDLELKYAQGDGVLIRSLTGASTGNIIDDCTIHHIGHNASSPFHSGEGIEFQGCGGNTASNNTVYECGLHGIFVIGVGDAADDNIIEYNTLYDHWYGAIDILVDDGDPQSVDGTIVRYNYVYNAGSGDFPAIHAQGGLERSLMPSAG